MRFASSVSKNVVTAKLKPHQRTVQTCKCNEIYFQNMVKCSLAAITAFRVQTAPPLRCAAVSKRDQHADWEVDQDSISDSSEDAEFLSVQSTENKQRSNEALFIDEIVSSTEYIRELFSRIRLQVYEGSCAVEPDPIVAYHCFGTDCCEEARLSGSLGDPGCHPPIPIRWNWSYSSSYSFVTFQAVSSAGLSSAFYTASWHDPAMHCVLVSTT